MAAVSVALDDDVCNWKQRADARVRHTGLVFRLIATMRRGSASGLPAASANYTTIEQARLGASTLLLEDRILRVMIVRDEIPLTYVEWQGR